MIDLETYCAASAAATAGGLAMKIALFHYMAGNTTMIRVATDEKYTDGLRISEYIEVEFPPRIDGVSDELARLDAQIAATTEKYAKLLDGLKASKAKLLEEHP